MINIVQLMLFSDGHLQEREREEDKRSHVKWSRENEMRSDYHRNRQKRQ
jgi:hypothetical protein